MPRILLTEDSKPVRECLKILLEEKGYDVVEANNGEEALALIDDTIDVLITDLNMPNIDGVELVRVLRKMRGIDIPVIVITGAYDMIPLLIDEDFPKVEIVKKPYSFEYIERKIAEFFAA